MPSITVKSESMTDTPSWLAFVFRLYRNATEFGNAEPSWLTYSRVFPESQYIERTVLWQFTSEDCHEYGHSFVNSVVVCCNHPGSLAGEIYPVIPSPESVHVDEYDTVKQVITGGAPAP
jgi:hypothetical protein